MGVHSLQLYCSEAHHSFVKLLTRARLLAPHRPLLLPLELEPLPGLSWLAVVKGAAAARFSLSSGAGREKVRPRERGFTTGAVAGMAAGAAAGAASGALWRLMNEPPAWLSTSWR